MVRLSPPANIQTFELQNSICWFDENGILFVTPNRLPYRHRTREEAEKDIQILLEKGKGRKLHMVMVPHPDIRPIPKEARQYISDLLNKVTASLALISTDKLRNLIFKILFVLKPPAFPHKIFLNEHEALEWTRYQMGMPAAAADSIPPGKKGN
jgi:hypothetical protein